jgi:hypothetical protein
MRLLHTTKLKIHQFVEHGSSATLIHREGDSVAEYAVPRYAILSHTWGDDEILFQDMQGDRSVAKSKSGYKKIKNSCARAARDGFDYIWIDTCCIDKSSSAELSEAINSMFRFYKLSDRCYAYLEDAHGTQPLRCYDDKEVVRPYWYSRGWTLQELIAPANIHFYSHDWRFLGTKIDHILEISNITGVDTYALNGGNLARMTVARRMSWMAHRKTTRLEDMAYCMLGIFDINMPLLYGEGSKAFVRLQEEIIKVTDDQSLFAWKEDNSTDYYREDYGDRFERYGLLASSSRFFASSDSVARFQRERPERPHPVSTSQGLMVSLLMCRDSSYQSGKVYLAVLDCQIGSIPGVHAGIRLRRVSDTGQKFVRVDILQLFRFARCNTYGVVEAEGFDPTKEQDELIDLRLREFYLCV